MVERGEGGFRPDALKALELYVNASKLGDAQANYHLAQIYKNGQGVKQDLIQSYLYYAQAARQNHIDAKLHLEQLATAGNAAAQYALGYYYFRTLGATSEAVRWCIWAEMQEHTLALKYLTETQFGADICLQMARQYEADQTNPARNGIRALACRSKAAASGDKEVALQLAQYYQVDHAGMKSDLNQAFDYYLRAGKLGHTEAWDALDRLGEAMGAQKQLALSQLYGSIFINEKAAYWHNKALEIESFKPK